MSTDHPADRITSRTTDRTAAVALVTGSLAGVVTMALHPTGHDLVRNASAGAANTLVTAVHELALLAEPLVLAGTLALTRRLRAESTAGGAAGGGPGDAAVGAFVFFAMANVAVLVAAAASGLIAPGVVRGLAAADEPARAAIFGALDYTGLVNRAFARLYVLLGGVAILLWSGAMLAGRALSRALAGYGVVLGAALALGAATGHLRFDVHGFGLVVLGQGVWTCWVAAHLWRAPAHGRGPR